MASNRGRAAGHSGSAGLCPKPLACGKQRASTLPRVRERCAFDNGSGLVESRFVNNADLRARYRWRAARLRSLGCREHLGHVPMSGPGGSGAMEALDHCQRARCDGRSGRAILRRDFNGWHRVPPIIAAPTGSAAARLSGAGIERNDDVRARTACSGSTRGLRGRLRAA